MRSKNNGTGAGRGVRMIGGLVVAFLVLVAPSSMSAAPEHGEADHVDDRDGALFVLKDDKCDEDYAAELEEVGLKLDRREFQSLDALAKIVELPPGVSLRHLVIAKGYAIANHASPLAVQGIFAERPQIRGLIGPSGCPSDIDHSRIHVQTPVQF